MNRKHAGLIAAAAVIIAGGTGAGLALAAGGTTATPAAAPAGAVAGDSYAWYQSMMGSLEGGGGSMMGGTSYGWMTGSAGYRWMTGGAVTAPAWMRGSALPGFMMGTSGDPGQVMGRLWAGAPGPRISPAQAAVLGGQVPAGATIDRAANQVTVTGSTVRLTVLASPAGGPDETFRIAGLVNPAIVVSAGTHVTIQVINADPGTAHGLAITSGAGASSQMPMMTARPAFTGSALWFLGNPTSAGMHQATLSFTASTPGSYQYLCPVPGHAPKGMTGTFTVT